MSDRGGDISAGAEGRKSVSSYRGILLAAAAIAVLAGVYGWLGLKRGPIVEQQTTSVSPPAEVTAAAVRPSPDLATAKSVAVLPLTGVGGDPAVVVLAEGVSEELIERLGRVPGLRTVARTSSFSFRGGKVAPVKIGRQLGVAHLVVGEIRGTLASPGVRLGLIRVETGEEVWSRKFLPEDGGMVVLPELMAGAVAEALGFTASDAKAGAAAANPEALLLYYRGRQAWHLGTAEGREHAEDFLNKALALEPDFARAHAALAGVWLARNRSEQEGAELGRSNTAFLPNILTQLKEALRLEPELAEAHALLGAAYAGAWQASEAKRELETAIRLNPNDATAHQWLAQVLETEGRLDEALDLHRRAVELDPRSSRNAGTHAMALVLAGQLTEALRWADHALALQADNSQARCWRAWALMELRRMPEAVEEARRLVRSGGALDSIFAAAVLYRAGHRTEAEDAFRQIPAAAKTSVYYLLAVMGQRDDVIALMAPAVARPGELPLLYYLPAFDSIRSHDRFREILRDAGTGPAHSRAQAQRARWREANGSNR